MMTSTSHDGRARLWRSRWAAIGAAVAVSLGGGGLFIAQAASGPPSAMVTIDPLRILDTRAGDLGLSGPFVSAVGRDLTVTGSIPTASGTRVVVPTGATGVVLNVTVVLPSADGFLSVRPATATGVPTTSSLNFTAGDIVPNAVTVQLPTSGADAGKIEIIYNAFDIAGPTADVLVDVVGYLQEGATTPAASPAQIVWVAKSGGDFTSLSAAVASINDAAMTKPYVVKIAPGVYTETAPVAMRDYVDVEGSGQDATTITCSCTTGAFSGVITAGAINMELRYLTVASTGSGTNSTAIYTSGVIAGSVSLLHVTATATGASDSNAGIRNSGSAPSISNVTATATGLSNDVGVYNFNTSSPDMNNVTAIADIAVANTEPSSPTIRNSRLIGSSAIENSGGATAKVSSSMVSGLVSGTGFACVGAHDAAFTALNATCT